MSRYNIEAVLVDHYPGGRKVHSRILIDFGATVLTSVIVIKYVLQVLDDSSTKFFCALQMSMLEDRSSYINVSESTQDMDVGEVNPTHANHNGSKTSKDTEDPSWNISIKTRRQRRHLQHWKRLGCHYIYLYCVLVRNIVKMDDPDITMEEYIRLEEEKAHRRVFNDTLTSEAALSCEPTISSLNNDEIDFRISFDESDDEDCTIIFDKNSFSYKIIYVNDLKTDSENDDDKVNMPLFPSPKPTVSYFDDLDFFKDFENEFPAIVYNDAQTSKSDLLTEPISNPQHIDEFNLKDETSLSECDEEEQNVLNFNDLFPFNVIYPDELKTDTDNDNDKVDIEHSSGDLSVKPLPDVINTDVGAYAHGSNKLLETSHDTSNKFFKTETFIKELNVTIMTWNYPYKGMSFIFLIKNLYVPFGIPFDPKLFYKDGIKLGQV
ncbi:hypothetical protein Tco_0549143 [Tanacetum coccineum]